MIKNIKLIYLKKFDREYPNKYIDEVLKFINLSKDEFNDLCDKFRSPHIWKKTSNGFLLRHTVNKDGADD